MSSPLKIRAATEADIPFVLACEAGPSGVFVQADDEATHLKNLSDSDFTYLIAESEEGSLLGYAMLVASGEARKEWRRIIIDKPGGGTGKAFMRAVCTKMFAAGTDTIWLDVYEDNERARHVYRTLGFEETGTMDGPDGPERKLVVMELKRPE